MNLSKTNERTQITFDLIAIFIFGALVGLWASFLSVGEVPTADQINGWAIAWLAAVGLVKGVKSPTDPISKALADVLLLLSGVHLINNVLLWSVRSFDIDTLKIFAASAASLLGVKTYLKITGADYGLAGVYALVTAFLLWFSNLFLGSPDVGALWKISLLIAWIVPFKEANPVDPIKVYGRDGIVVYLVVHISVVTALLLNISVDLAA